MLVNTFLILLLLILIFFLVQMAIQFIVLEKKLDTMVEVLEDELIDVFGSHSFKKLPPSKPKPKIIV